MLAGTWKTSRAPTARPAPSSTPAIPPAAESAIDSTRNWARIRPRRAPSAMRTPISRVRSVTETSMMFMTPMPPTSSARAQTPKVAAPTIRARLSNSSAEVSLEKISKSFSSCGCSPRTRRRVAMTSSSALGASSGEVAWMAMLLFRFLPKTTS